MIASVYVPLWWFMVAFIVLTLGPDAIRWGRRLVGEVTDGEEMTLGLRGPGEPSALPRDWATSPSLTSTGLLGGQNGAPVDGHSPAPTGAAGVPFDWDSMSEYGDAA